MAKRYFAPLPYGSFAAETGLEFDGTKANEMGWAEYQSNYEQDGSPFIRTVVDKP